MLAASPGITVTPDLSVQRAVDHGVDRAAHPSDVFLRRPGPTSWPRQGDTGQGVTVAVLDTGIDNLPDFAGRLIGGVDLTGGNNPFHDSYGHGTFVAGLIAGNGASSSGQYSGEAPGADLVAIKVAGATGMTDLATVIAGVQWAVDQRGAGTASGSSTCPWGSSPSRPRCSTRWTRPSRRPGTPASRW